ncbi:MAG: leucine-rich repeat protein [Clostridia bacterium]|nr:leucine-rich repeat protein [Clostridia bacterium]
MKRVLSLFLSCIFVLGVCFSTPIVASATEANIIEFTSASGNVFQYVEGSNECSVKKWNGSDVALTLTDVQYNETTYTITGILSGAFSECTALETITIKSNIKTIEPGAFVGCTALTGFIEDANSLNSNFKVDAGVLFNENQTTLIAYPAGKIDEEGNKVTEYTIPADVKEIAANAFSGAEVTLFSENPDGITNPDGLVIHKVPTEGEHTVNGYVINGNEINKVCSCGIKLETVATIEYVGADAENEVEWAKSANINAASGYSISLSADGTYNATLSVETISDGKLSFWVKKETESAQKVTVDLGVELDSTAPTGTIALGETSWNEYLNNVTFDLFFKEAKTVTITPADENGSGVKSVEYYISTEVKSLSDLESLAAEAWSECALDGSGSAYVNLIKNSKNIVYAKIIDNVGNVKYISSNGIVLYSDSITETENINYTKFSNVSVEVKVNLNGNTIKEVKNGDTVLTSGYSISVSDDVATITFLSEMLDGLSIGESQITISYNPLGETYVENQGDAPSDTKIAFLINRATPEVTAPKGKNDLVYDGEEQELIENGTTTGGTMQYKLGEDGQWNENIPKAVNAGTYTVYYKVTGNENYNGVVESSVEVTIAPKTITATLTQDSGVYNGNTHQPTVKISDLCGTETLTNGTDFTVEYSDNINVGTVTVTVTLEETSVAKNYTFANNAKTTTLNYTITAGVASIKTAPTVKTGLVYTGSAQELVTAGEATNGTMQYRLSENESWSPAIPTAINAGTYKVYYKAAGDENYSDSDVASVDVAIAKATPTTENFKIDLPTNLIFNGDPKTVTVTCGADIGDVTVEYYSGETKLESAPVEVGTYTVKINVAASDNYNAANGITSDAWGFTVTACTKHEWKNSKCEICKIDCEHKYEDGKSAISNTISKHPTCVEEGVLLSQCKICDYKEESPLDKDLEKGHKMSDWNETVKVTCSSTGTEERVCELGCGHKETRSTEKDPDNHTYGDWVITAATCVADGVKVKTCTNTECKHELKETIAKDPTAHKMATEWEVTKEPTCVETGLQVKACLNAGCDHEVEEVIAIKADAHNLGGWVVTKAAKCTVAGEITRFCKNGNCEYKVTDSLDADGKTHSFAQDFTIIEATCIATGSKFKACENEGCKEVAEKTEIAINPDAHKNVETINVKQPTCEEKGYTGDEFCNDCKKTFEPGIEVDALGHTESDWIVDKEATFTEDGARHTACTVCNKELKKEVIAKRVLETPVVKIENAGSGIKVSWSQDEDATGYTVYRSEYNPSTKKWSKWKNRGTAAATKKNWTDKTVKEGVTYRFTVRSVNGDIKSAYKATSGILYVVAPKVTVSISSTGLLAKWNKINNATSYIVYRAELGTDGNWGKWVQLGTTKAEKNTWSDDKVKSGVTYKYTVRAVVGKVKSGYTGSSAIVYLEQPLLKIANAANGITGKWEQVAGATGYTIYRSEYNPSTKKWTKWLNLGTTKATAKSFTDKTAKSGYQYKYTIRAVNGKLKSTYQDSNKLVCLAQPTLKISNVANGIQGKWTKVDGATGYIIYRSELKDGKWTKWVSLGTAKSTAKSFTDKTVKSGVQYKYTIRAKNGSSKSSYIDSNTSIFLSVPTVKIANAATGVKVTWGKIEGAKNYLVYRSEYNSSTKKWSKWKTLETVDTTSFVDDTAVSNVKYKYTVRALNGEFRSYYTASAELLYLKAPTVTAEKEDEAIKVSWTKVDGAKSYIIYRSELSKDGKWSKWIKLGTAGEKYTSCKDKTVKEDVIYKYTVRAVNGKLMGYYVASEQILNGVVTESTPENPKTDIVA